MGDMSMKPRMSAETRRVVADIVLDAVKAYPSYGTGWLGAFHYAERIYDVIRVGDTPEFMGEPKKCEHRHKEECFRAGGAYSLVRCQACGEVLFFDRRHGERREGERRAVVEDYGGRRLGGCASKRRTGKDRRHG